MKFTLPTNELRNITNVLSRVVSKDTPGKESSRVFLIVSSGKVIFKTKQLDFNVVYTITATNSEDGGVLVPIQVLESVINSLIDSHTTIELVDKKLLIKTTTSNSEIFILDSEDDFSIEAQPTQSSFPVNREMLIRGFKNVYHAAAENIIKPEIASVCLYINQDSLYFVSTDSFRLAETRFLLDGQKPESFNVLIPIKSVQKVVRVFESVADTDIAISIVEGVIYIASSNVFVKMGVVNGTFPNYKNIMPKTFESTLTILKSDLVVFLKKAPLFSNKLNKLSFSIQDEKHIVLEFENETIGLTKNIIPASIQGTTQKLPSFNYRFISDAISVIDDDRIVFSFLQDLTKPLMIRGVNDTALTTIISPLIEADK